MWLNVYVFGWALTTMAALVAIDAFPEHRISPPRGRGVSTVVAGVLWPVLWVGLLQLVCIMCVAKSIVAASDRAG